MDKEKMMELAVGLDKFAKFVIVMNIVAAVAAVFLAAIVIGIAEPKYQEKVLTLEYSELTFSEEALLSPDNDDTMMEYLLVGLLITVPIGIYEMILFRRMLSPVKDGRPFEADTSRNIKKMAIWVIVGGIASNILNNVAGYIDYRTSDLVALIGPERVEYYVFDWHFDSSFLVIAAILFLVYYIFKYGEVLQQESDETL